MHQKKKSKKHGIGWTLLKICAELPELWSLYLGFISFTFLQAITGLKITWS